MGSVMPILTAQEQNAVAHWASGLDLAVLAEVFDEAITIAIMQRQLDSAMRASIAAQCAAQPWQLAWRGPADATLEQALIRSMPAPHIPHPGPSSRARIGAYFYDFRIAFRIIYFFDIDV